MRQRAERRGDYIAEKIPDRLPDQRHQAELRIVEVAVHRQLQRNGAVCILQQRDGEFERQLERVRAFDPLAEREFLERDLVVALDQAVAHPVVEVDREAPGRDAVAGEAHRVRRCAGQVDVAQLHAKGAAVARRERIDRPGQARVAEFVDAAFERELAARFAVARQAVGRARELIDLRHVSRTQAVVGKIERALFDPHASHGYRIGAPIAGVRLVVRGAGCGLRCKRARRIL